MRCFHDKTAMTGLEQIRDLILSLAAFVILAFFVRFAIDATEEKSQEELCRASVFAHMDATLDTGVPGFRDQKVVPMQCHSYERELPLEFGEQSVDGIKENIGYLAARCWWMFGEGVYHTKLEQVFGNSCHVCYTFTINDKGIKGLDEVPRYDKSGDVLFDGRDIENFLFDNIYKADSVDREYLCENDKDDDEDGDIDSEDEDCQRIDEDREIITDCWVKGGECVQEGRDCGEGYRKYSDIEWSCQKGQECCVEEDRSYTYYEYLYDGGVTSAVLLPSGMEGNLEDFKFQAGETYAVVIIDKPRSFIEKAGDSFIVDALCAPHRIINKLVPLSVLGHLCGSGEEEETDYSQLDTLSFIMIDTLSNVKEEHGCNYERLR